MNTTAVETAEDRVRRVIRDVLGVETDRVKYDAKLVGNLGAETGDFLTLQFELENEFKVEHGTLFEPLLPAQLIAATVKDAIEFVKKRIPAACQ